MIPSLPRSIGVQLGVSVMGDMIGTEAEFEEEAGSSPVLPEKPTRKAVPFEAGPSAFLAGTYMEL
jgi:hypothetical protein